MTREIPQSKKIEVVKLYFEGLSYDDIAKRTGVAKGSVAAIVETLRDGQFPQFEQLIEHLNELREMVVAFKKSQISSSEAIFLFVLVKKLTRLGVEPAYVESWIRMCKAVPEGEFSRIQIIQAASKLAKLEQEGLSYEQTLENLRSSSIKLERLEGEVAELRTEKTELHARKEELTQVNQHLEAESTRLQGRLNAMAVKEKEQENHLQELGDHDVPPLDDTRYNLTKGGINGQKGIHTRTDHQQAP
jgi:predicted transcriptional regulator